MDEAQKRDIARRTVEGKLGFIRHALVYLLVNAALALINNLGGGEYPWWLWPAFGWGLGVVGHFVSAFLLRSGALRSRLIAREMEKLDG